MAAQAAEQAEGVTPRVIVANISRGQVSTQMMVGTIQALQAQVIHGLVMVESGPYLDSGRNKAIANAFTQPDWEWLLFIDSDIEFTPAHVTALLAPYAAGELHPGICPVIGGLYINPFGDEGVPGETEFEDKIGPVAYEWVSRDDLHGEKAGVPTMTFRRLSRKALAAQRDHLHVEQVAKVACVGTGFMAIHRTFLTQMSERYGQPLPWFEEPVLDGVHYGEDMGFCLRVMAMGYPVLVNRACTPLHHKTIKLI